MPREEIKGLFASWSIRQIITFTYCSEAAKTNPRLFKKVQSSWSPSTTAVSTLLTNLSKSSSVMLYFVLISIFSSFNVLSIRSNDDSSLFSMKVKSTQGTNRKHETSTSETASFQGTDACGVVKNRQNKSKTVQVKSLLLWSRDKFIEVSKLNFWNCLGYLLKCFSLFCCLTFWTDYIGNKSFEGNLLEINAVFTRSATWYFILSFNRKFETTKAATEIWSKRSLFQTNCTILQI